MGERLYLCSLSVPILCIDSARLHSLTTFRHVVWHLAQTRVCQTVCQPVWWLAGSSAALPLLPPPTTRATCPVTRAWALMVVSTIFRSSSFYMVILLAFVCHPISSQFSPRQDEVTGRVTALALGHDSSKHIRVFQLLELVSVAHQTTAELLSLASSSLHPAPSSTGHTFSSAPRSPSNNPCFLNDAGHHDDPSMCGLWHVESCSYRASPAGVAAARHPCG